MFSAFDNAIASIEDNRRFELRVSARNRKAPDHVQAHHPEYFSTATGHGVQLFEQVYAPDEPILVMYRRYGTRRSRIRGRRLQGMLGEPKSTLAVRRFRYAKRRRWIWAREALMKCRPTPHQVAAVFDRIVRADLGGEERGQYFFVSPDSGIVFHLYDDRGAVVAGPRDVLPDDWGPMATRRIGQFSGPAWFRHRLGRAVG